MFNMVFDIQVGKYKLQLLEKAEVKKSVDTLADTCEIILPGAAYNQALHVENNIKRGDRVTVYFGYDNLPTTPEFTGYLREINTDGNNLTLRCENDIFLTRVSVNDKVFGITYIKNIAEYVVKDLGLKIECTYDFKYDSFPIVSQTAFDVLKKLQQETKANIFIKNGVLHIHEPYLYVFNRVKYDFTRNIETADLKYKTVEDRKYQIVVEGIGKDGKRITETMGAMGGDKRVIKIYGVTDRETLKKRAEQEIKYIVYDGYEGSITGWLIPYVQPGDSAIIYDAEYEYKNGTYYIVAVTTTFGENGGVRKIELGRKLDYKADGNRTTIY